jgi:hypothetical protein
MRTSGPSNYRGTVNLTGSTSQCGLWGAWVRIKALPPNSDGYLSVLQLLNLGNNVVMDFKLNSSGVISFQPYSNGTAAPTLTSPSIPLNTWVWLGVAWKMQSTNSQLYNLRCLSMNLGGPLVTWGSVDGLNSASFSFTGVNVGLQTGGVGPMLRLGCPTLYSMNSFSDIAYPPDVIPPVEGSYVWYVNADSGNDGNDGATPSTAWKSADKLSAESQYCGLLDSNVTGAGNGDVVTIDTSSAPLVMDTNPLTISTQGVAVQPATGQSTIRCQAEKFLSNSAFKLTSGLARTYQTADTQADIVAWENDKWMWHIKSSSYGASASVTNPSNGTTTNYATTAAALDSLAGSFYTDGTNLYIHPFGDTNPVSDGKIYTRSINRAQQSAVIFLAGNYRATGLYVRKTTLVDSADNDFGAYCFQDEVLHGTGFSNLVENGYFAYGDKHCFGSTGGATASTLLVRNTDCEQGHPYCGYGGQSPFVSYSGVTTADNVHTYQACTCLARSGLIGSTAGDPIGTGGDIILSHNNGAGSAFATIIIDDCNFASGSIDMGAATNLVITDHTQASLVYTYSVNTTVQEATLTDGGVQMETGAASLLVQNSVIKPIPPPGQTALTGFLLQGNATIRGCTFDLSGLTGTFSGLIQRSASMNLSFRNNVYLVPSAASIPLLANVTPSDQLLFDHNAYQLGGGKLLAVNFTNSAGQTDTYDFAQWQSLGYDCINSSLNASLLLQNDMPQSGSPLANAGIDLGSLMDYTGTTYAHRNTIGAYQGSAAYRAQQSLSTVAPLATENSDSIVHLPSTTDQGLPVTYTIVSGPAQLNGNTLTFTGVGTVTLSATQPGSSADASLSVTETLSIVALTVANDTPTLPEWALILMGVLLAWTGARSLRNPADRVCR